MRDEVPVLLPKTECRPWIRGGYAHKRDQCEERFDLAVNQTVRHPDQLRKRRIQPLSPLDGACPHKRGVPAVPPATGKDRTNAFPMPFPGPNP